MAERLAAEWLAGGGAGDEANNNSRCVVFAKMSDVRVSCSR